MAGEREAANAIIRAIVFQLRIVAWFFGLLFRLFGLWRDSRPQKPVILKLSPMSRFAHTHIVGGSGHGKTQLIQHIFETHDLPELQRGGSSVIVIDSQGDLIRTISHLKELSPRISSTV